VDRGAAFSPLRLGFLDTRAETGEISITIRERPPTAEEKSLNTRPGMRARKLERIESAANGWFALQSGRFWRRFTGGSDHFIE
jgi:hypothetical protein